MDAATAKFEQALPLAILPISTQLAALHSSRTSSQVTVLYSCARCGSDLTACSTRVVRLKHSPSRTLATTCYACGEITSIPIGTGNASQFPSYKKASQVLKGQLAPVAQPAPQPPTPVHASASPAPVKPLPKASINPPVPATAKPKKKSGLQQMLQRNREMVQKQTKADQAKPAGLSDFLSTL